MMRRARIPLVPEAVEAANQALYSDHPELKGRKLTMAAADRALRQEWLDNYIASGGSVTPLKLKAPPKCAVTPCPSGALTEKEAQGIFDELRRNAKLPFNYPVDCCFSRAHAMCRIMESKGITCRKFWLFSGNWPVSPDLRPTNKAGKPIMFPDDSGTRQPIIWMYHVAPIVKVVKNDGTVEDRIIDPSLARKPITKDEWRRIQGNRQGSYSEESDSKAYFQNEKFHFREEDPDGSETRKQMENHRHERDRLLRAEKAKKKKSESKNHKK